MARAHDARTDPMESLVRLLGASASHGLLMGQLLFSLAFMGSCEIPNWLAGPRQVNACLERWMTVSALFFPSGLASGKAPTNPALAPGRRGIFR